MPTWTALDKLKMRFVQKKQLKAGKTEAISPLLKINEGRQTLFSFYASARHPQKEELLP
jgi:hypothetical protein